MKFETTYEQIVHQKRAREVIGNPLKQQIHGYYFESVEEGIKKVVNLTPRGSTVDQGSSTMVTQPKQIDHPQKLPVELYTGTRKDCQGGEGQGEDPRGHCR